MLIMVIMDDEAAFDTKTPKKHGRRKMLARLKSMIALKVSL